ncbi:MAG: hypothetical protein L6Q29_02310 [Candidatus Pacebacteria bacterium]|nr:hypothetical protein [Candidatus Paceibacterota bacterium]NUQ57656.1 hypothetical protein [Candidatus Paceibacter sp.]
MEKPKEPEKKEHGFEVMKTPEIVVQEERGAQLFSLLLKAENPEWGETETPLAKETTEYFRDNPIDPEILKTIKDFYEEGVDEETLYNLALTYQHPERAEKVLETAAKYKPHVKNPQEVCQKFLALLENFDQTFSASPLSEKFTVEIERDKNERLQRIEETRKRIGSIIDFFKPYSKTTDVKKLSFVPTDPLYKKNSGRNFSAFPGEQIIISHVDNVDNQDHEFSHGIINPIVEKLSQQLTDEQKEKISRLANEKLKQDYGDGHFSLLCEEFIRTYNDVFKRGEKPQTYEDFVQKISGTTEDQFQKFLLESISLKARLEQFGINTIDDFKNKSQEYFEKFEKNPLRDLIFEFYQEYSNRTHKEAENFEQFVLAKFPPRI